MHAEKKTELLRLSLNVLKYVLYGPVPLPFPVPVGQQDRHYFRGAGVRPGHWAQGMGHTPAQNYISKVPLL